MKTLLGLALAAIMTTGLSAQELDVDDGRALFKTYCWQCHGLNAKGNGPMAEMLAIPTPDLTALSDRNGGTFPVATVAIKIDGRSPMLAHGGDMPLFGPVLSSDQNVALATPTGQPMMVGLPLANLIAYLMSVQGK